MSTISISANLIQSAIKAKSPVTGIPILGHAPFRILRSRLRDSLKGLKVISATYDTGDYKKWLVVEAIGERVRATRKFYPMGRAEAGKLIDKWLKSERRKGSKAQRSVRKSAAEKQLETLRVKLAKLTGRPVNPAIASGHRHSDYKREQFLRWHNEKPLRRQFKSRDAFGMAAITGKVQAELSNPAQHSDWYSPEPVWGAQRYASYFSEERKWLKAKISLVEEKIQAQSAAGENSMEETSASKLSDSVSAEQIAAMVRERMQGEKFERLYHAANAVCDRYEFSSLR